jgi:hypothetical protein
VAKLTAKQEKYVQGLVAGLSQRKAYREAYPSSNKWKDATVDNKASALLRKDEILARYNELMDEHKAKALWTREEAVSTLKWLVERSISSIDEQDEGYVRQGTSNALVAAIKELNELELLYPLKAKQVQKLDAEISKGDTQENKLESLLGMLGETIDDS